MKSVRVFLPLALLLILCASLPARAQSDSTFWIYAKIEVNTSRNTPDGEKNEFRVYVSELTPVTAEVWNGLYLSTRARKNVSDYFDATVGKAAESRGEQFSYYDQDVEWDCTCVGTANEPRTKAEVEEQRNKDIETARENGHPVLFFNWDPTGKNKEKDLAGEMKKGGKPPASAPPKKSGAR